MISQAGLLRGDSAALQQYGQKLYRQGDFKTAVEAFTEALMKKDADYVGILDNRAAARTKLTQYDLALRDARQMIKKDKHDERGYLRCAKVLLLDGKPEKALDVYAYGLKTLASENPRRQLVEQLHNKLHTKMFAKCQDPFSLLPLEIADMVLEHFDFKEVVAILRVSKKWEQFLTSMRKLWMRIDLSGARGKIHWSSVRAYIRRSKAMLSHAVIGHISVPSTQKTLELLSRCPNLEHLEVGVSCDPGLFYDLFEGSRRLKTLIISGHMTMPQEYISKFFATLPLLEHAEFRSTKASPSSRVQWPSKLPKLKRLTLASQEPSPSDVYVPALYVPGLVHPLDRDSVPNLEELRLSWNPTVYQTNPFRLYPMGFSRLRRFDISGLFAGFTFDLPPTIEHVRVHGGAGLGQPPFAFNRPLPNLQTLILEDTPWVTLGKIGLFLEQAKAPLRVLHLDSCVNIWGSDLTSLRMYDNFNALTELSIYGMRSVNDEVTVTLTSKMSDLKVLNLSCTHITGCTIKMFADLRASNEDGKPRIDRLYVKGCDEVSSDAVVYGRAKGIEIFT